MSASAPSHSYGIGGDASAVFTVEGNKSGGLAEKLAAQREKDRTEFEARKAALESETNRVTSTMDDRFAATSSGAEPSSRMGGFFTIDSFRRAQRGEDPIVPSAAPISSEANAAAVAAAAGAAVKAAAAAAGDKRKRAALSFIDDLDGDEESPPSASSSRAGPRGQQPPPANPLSSSTSSVAPSSSSAVSSSSAASAPQNEAAPVSSTAAASSASTASSSTLMPRAGAASSGLLVQQFPSSSSPAASSSAASFKLGKDPSVNTDFLPDKEREASEAALRASLRAQWLAEQDRVKKEKVRGRRIALCEQESLC